MQIGHFCSTKKHVSQGLPQIQEISCETVRGSCSALQSAIIGSQIRQQGWKATASQKPFDTFVSALQQHAVVCRNVGERTDDCKKQQRVQKIFCSQDPLFELTPGQNTRMETPENLSKHQNCSSTPVFLHLSEMFRCWETILVFGEKFRCILAHRNVIRSLGCCDFFFVFFEISASRLTSRVCKFSDGAACC